MALLWQVSSYSNLSAKNSELLQLMYPDGVPDQEKDLQQGERHYLEDMVYSFDQAMTDPSAVLALYPTMAIDAPENLEDVEALFYESLRALILGERYNAFPSALPPPKVMYFYSQEQYQNWKKGFLVSRDQEAEKSREWLQRQYSSYRRRMSLYMFYEVL